VLKKCSVSFEVVWVKIFFKRNWSIGSTGKKTENLTHFKANKYVDTEQAKKYFL